MSVNFALINNVEDNLLIQIIQTNQWQLWGLKSKSEMNNMRKLITWFQNTDSLAIMFKLLKSWLQVKATWHSIFTIQTISQQHVISKMLLCRKTTSNHLMVKRKLFTHQIWNCSFTNYMLFKTIMKLCLSIFMTSCSEMNPHEHKIWNSRFWTGISLPLNGWTASLENVDRCLPVCQHFFFHGPYLQTLPAFGEAHASDLAAGCLRNHWGSAKGAEEISVLNSCLTYRLDLAQACFSFPFAVAEEVEEGFYWNHLEVREPLKEDGWFYWEDWNCCWVVEDLRDCYCYMRSVFGQNLDSSLHCQPFWPGLYEADSWKNHQKWLES